MQYDKKKPGLLTIAALSTTIFLASCSSGSNSSTTTDPATDPAATPDPSPNPSPDSTPDPTTDPVTDPAEPVFNQNLFDVNSSQVDNVFFPLVPGTTAILEGEDKDGDLERLVTNVSHETKMVDGIEVAIVVEREYEKGEFVEEIFSWYAQDIEGNVWSMGEASTEYEDGVVVDTDGSWESGVDVQGDGEIGQAGIVMKANPAVGDTYQHVIFPDDEEDAAEVINLSATYTFLDGRTTTALQIHETDPLSPDSDGEFIYYVQSEGLIAEVDADGSDRIELIERQDQANPQIVAADFTSSLTIDNRWLPLVVGTIRKYELETEDGLETLTIEVLDETRDVMGITTRIVRDQVFLDGLIIEDTHDWFAQDNSGNVWYFGEEVDNYEYDDEGNLLEVNNDSAWEAGINGAQPGIIMLSNPRVGDSYRQEFGLGEAEDLGAVVGINVEVVLADGRSYNTLKTRDWNPLEPEAGNEFKYYAEGFGVVKEENEEDGETVELVN